MTPEQLAAIKARTEAAQITGPIVWSAGDGYSLEYADGSQVAFYPTDCSGEGDYETYNRRQFAQINFAKHVREDVSLLLAEVEKLGRALDDCAARLGEAAPVIQAVRDWDNGGQDRAPEASRLLHNAYVKWHWAHKEREANDAG